MKGSWIAVRALAPFLPVLLLSARPAAASPAGPVLASIEKIGSEGLRHAMFVLPREARVRVRCEGVADSKGTVFLSEGWILDLDSRKAVWTLSGADPTRNWRTHNWSAEQEITLPAGRYAAYFAAYGGPFPIDKKIKILGIEIGRVEADWGPVVSWDKEGVPKDWGIKVQAVDAGFTPGLPPAGLPEPYPQADVRLLGLASSTVRRVQIDLDRTVDFDIHMTGEFPRASRTFADGAWLTDRRTWTRVWMPEYSQTSPAGGARKNRVFDGTISLPAGSYLLTAVTDGTHATGDWNAAPPWDPDSWGVEMTVKDPAQRRAVRITPDAGLPEPALAITRAGDNDFEKKPFSLTRPARVLVRSEGEESSGGELVDFGWIERLSDLSPVWHMRRQESYSAGGAPKNRLVESVVELPAGAYALCYVTDDSHAYGDWNQEPPWDEDAWGISIAEMPPERSERAGGVIVPGPPGHEPTVLSLAPVRDGKDIVKEFEITDPVRVLLIAVGESSGREMVDSGWLVDEKTGRKVWAMTYDETEGAGGSRKNRIVRTTLQLPRGGYALHFVTDDSHAFGDWNAPEPDQPELWGVTLIEED